MPRPITPRTSLDNLRHEAKRWLKALRANDADARTRLARVLPLARSVPTLRDVQLALAREFGLPGWAHLKEQLLQEEPLRRYERVAAALVHAYRMADADAMAIVWDYFGHMRAWPAMKRYVRLSLGKTEEPSDGEHDDIAAADAQYLVARAQGFDSWESLAAFAALPRNRHTHLAAKAVTAFAGVDPEAGDIILRSHDWSEVLTIMREQQVPGLHAAGQMSEALLERVSRLEHLTTLNVSGSRELTDEGVRYLARLPHLRNLNLSGCAVSDRGLGFLTRLPALETLNLAWTSVTDAGMAPLAACERLATVDLTGTASGDEAIRMLAGKDALSDFRSGDRVTDAGLALLHDLPVFKTWQGGTVAMSLLSSNARPNRLMLRGPFTDRGMAQLAGLEGLFALDLDSDRLSISGVGLGALVDLPHLEWLACDAKDESMPAIASLPHLRFLLCQDTTAGDDGFVSLSRSHSIEYIWGRRCHNLQRRGFVALAEMPALRALSVSCKNVDDVGVSALPRFPALTELMPMDVPDAGYRHIARCQRLESLVLMYCRDTTDAATAHIAALPALKKYFASFTRITDRTPEMLSGMDSLEEIAFDSCAGLTTAGVAALARLPRLRELRAEGMARVTPDVIALFAPRVRVRYSP
jgi:hypothetical protein